MGHEGSRLGTKPKMPHTAFHGILQQSFTVVSSTSYTAKAAASPEIRPDKPILAAD